MITVLMKICKNWLLLRDRLWDATLTIKATLGKNYDNGGEEEEKKQVRQRDTFLTPPKSNPETFCIVMPRGVIL